ncbi:MAG TPA: hypothetical protein VG753_02360 [Candidatus Paceibacterota bacterium]|nr:hypothetical protein [Candidatus Paceibacterota bacterium]
MESLVANITRRIQMPKGVKFAKGVKASLGFKRVALEGDPQNSVIEVFFELENDGKEMDLIIETDTSLDEARLPNPAKNKKTWMRVRELVLDGFSGQDAYDIVAMKSFARACTFSCSDSYGDSHDFWFYIETPNLPTIAGTPDKHDVVPFLLDKRTLEDVVEEHEEERSRKGTGKSILGLHR